MLCEICKNASMIKSTVNYVVGEGYSRIIKFTCPECDYNFKQVA